MQIQKLLIAVVIVVIGFCETVKSQAACAITVDQTAWMEKALRTWNKVRRESLRLPADEIPWLILFDETCVINVNAGSRRAGSGSKIMVNGRSMAAATSPHGGRIELPEGGGIPARLTSFAAPYDNGESSFLVFALPSIWRQAPHLKDEKNVDRLVLSVFVHEMTHTLHRNFYARLNELEKKLPKGEGVDDDIIQNKFSKIDEYRAMFDVEKDLLFQAVAASNKKIKRNLAKKAHEKIQERRSRFLTGDNAVYADLEELFLTMEGAANWAAYKAARDQGMNDTDALKTVRGSRKYWSQDEGLALFLVIDALLPNWKRRAFAPRNATVFELLAAALK